MELSGWGRYPRIEARGRYFETQQEAAALAAASDTWIPHGAGKSYGDSALNRNVIFTRRYNQLIAFDDQHGIVQGSGGMTLAEIIDLVLPAGWFLQVTPGTQLITLGGAVAGDVHGKNHHLAGCFSASVLSFRLMLPDGRIITCSRQENLDLFRATCGGMGLTGLILDATLQLQPVNSAYIRETTIRCAGLDEVMALFETYRDSPYSIAWIDCLAGGKKLGRGLMMLGEHTREDDLSRPFPFAPAIPRMFPSAALNRFSASLFNAGYYYVNSGMNKTVRRVSLDRFFYPLDRIVAWNRVYGTAGFMQYQFVLPESSARQGLRAVLAKVTGGDCPSFLGVLKRFGPQNENLLSFPCPGYTLALDFKMHSRLLPFLDELDAIVLDHGGRHYLAKDARLKREVFERGYPKAAEFRKIRQQYGLADKINSLQSRRLAI